jgi:HPt (histidine-containing phosphotransfer) domain-containing protein
MSRSKSLAQAAQSTATTTRGMRPPAAAAKPPLDLTHLRRFTLGSLDLEHEILDLYATQAPVMMRAIDRAASEREWRDATHTMKGSSASIGAWLVAKAAAEGEHVAEQPEHWASARRDIAAAVAASLAYVTSLLPTGTRQALG